MDKTRLKLAAFFDQDDDDDDVVLVRLYTIVLSQGFRLTYFHLLSKSQSETRS
jgi:hypothetical protein